MTAGKTHIDPRWSVSEADEDMYYSALEMFGPMEGPDIAVNVQWRFLFDPGFEPDQNWSDYYDQHRMAQEAH